MKKTIFYNIFFTTSILFALHPPMHCQASDFTSSSSFFAAKSNIYNIAFCTIDYQLSFIRDNLSISSTISGWKTIRPQKHISGAIDYGADDIGSDVSFKTLKGSSTSDSPNTDSLGMKLYDSQSIFIKPLEDQAEKYRLITPNGWKISESTDNKNIILEEDDGGTNQMWYINVDEAGHYIFTNVKSGHYLDSSDYPLLKTCEFPSPEGQQFLLFDRKYTGWDWYFDDEFGKYYYSGEEITDVEHPFYSEGSWGSIYTGLVWHDNDWLYVHLGKPDYNYKGLTYKNKNWWYISNGTIDRSFTGLTEFNDALWYVTEGNYDKSYNGSAIYNGKYYDVYDGKAAFQ